MQSPASTRDGAQQGHLLEALLSAALNAHRTGTLDELLGRRPLLTRRLMRRYLRPVLETAGDALAEGGRDALAVQWGLAWLLTRLRPDAAAGLEVADREAWLSRTSWRPFLAMICHYGFAPVREFRDRYHPAPGESAADQLCGLWAVGPSTFYRYLDKGKRLMVELLEERGRRAEAVLSLREAVQRAAYRELGLDDDDRRAAWHARQGAALSSPRCVVSGLWHLLQARDVGGFLALVQRFPVDVAADAQTDAMVARLSSMQALGPRQRFELQLAQASLWRMRSAPERERHAYEQALAIAVEAGDKRLLGLAYGALGRFHEPRDTDRAFACFEDSAEFLRQVAQDGAAPDPAVVGEYVACLVKLGWTYVLRNDPRSRSVLERAELLRTTAMLVDETVATLEQAWGEYWRRSGDLRRAVMHKHRALNIYERLGDQRNVLSTYNNLGLIYGEAKDFPRAIEYSERVLAMARSTSVDPYVVTGAMINLGVTYFWMERYADAIAHYEQALHTSLAAGLPVHANRARYNLAEAHYKQFQTSRDPEDERRGDSYAAAVLKASPEERDSFAAEAARNLKAEVLGSDEGLVHERLVPEEFASHYEEMMEVQRERQLLAAPTGASAHVGSRLAIAKAYAKVAAKERDAALALIDKHGLHEEFAATLRDLADTLGDGTLQQQDLVNRWRMTIGNLVDDNQRVALLQRLSRSGYISKSGYAEVCAVSLATASKHLGLLAERGLLVQTGKGPSTRYLLPP